MSTKRAVEPPEGPRYRDVVEIVMRLRREGAEAFLVGGCVRDMVLGRRPKDYDIATSARPEVVTDIFERTVPVGKAFGVVHVRVSGRSYEVATFRKDLSYRDGRRPEGVVFCTAEEDVARRDFTVNGLLFDPETCEVLDHTGGLDDLDARLLRAIGDPAERFGEDHLRLLRAVRFAVELDFEIDRDTWAAVCALPENLKRISAERIRDELKRIFSSPDPIRGLDLLFESGLLQVILPELGAGRRAIELVAEARARLARIHGVCAVDLSLALAATLLPLSTAGCKLVSTDGSRSRLEDAMPEVSSALSRLRLSRETERRVMGAVAVARCLLDDEVRSSRPHVRLRLLRWPGARDGLSLARAEAGRLGGAAAEEVERCLAGLESLSREDYRPAPLVTGEDLKALGLTPGPDFARILRAVEDAQLDGELTDQEEALELVRKLSIQQCST